MIKVKVEYQGYISQKMAVLRALVFHKHILFTLKTLPNKILAQSKLKEIEMLLPAFCTFPTMFSKGCFLRVFKRLLIDCMVFSTVYQL